MRDDSYASLLARKAWEAPSVGVDADVDAGHLFDFQRLIVRWALRRGRAAVWADCGLGKTRMQLTWADHLRRITGSRALILAPLAVAQQTVREGRSIGIDVTYARTQDDAGDAPIVIANYEMLDRFDVSHFGAVVLDESSILKAFDGKTRTQIIETFRETPYRLACTATPAPNDYAELGNHAEFLGVMNRVEMLATFFEHDASDTGEWMLKGHAAKAFWRWLCTWAVTVRRPSDLGCSDDAFVLPELRMHQHAVAAPSDLAKRVGQLFVQEARGLSEQREARRATLEARVQACAELVNRTPGQWLIFCDLNAEGDALVEAIDGAEQVAGSDAREVKEDRAARFVDGSLRVLVSKASIFGLGMNFQGCHQVAFVGLSNSFEQFYQAVRRVWRFGQKNAVDCHLITSDAEGAVVSNLRRKEEDAERMASEMVSSMAEMQRIAVRGSIRDRDEYSAAKRLCLPSWIRSEVA